MVVSFAAANMLVFAAGLAQAGGPMALTDSQLDGVTAGSAFVAATATGQSTGLYTQGGTQTFAAVTGSNNPFGGEAGLASGSAFTSGSNLISPGTATTSVVTNGGASGNLVYVVTVNDQTLEGGPVQGSGWSFSSGYTYVVGGLVPGCGVTCP